MVLAFDEEVFIIKILKLERQVGHQCPNHMLKWPKLAVDAIFTGKTRKNGYLGSSENLSISARKQ